MLSDREMLVSRTSLAIPRNFTAKQRNIATGSVEAHAHGAARCAEIEAYLTTLRCGRERVEPVSAPLSDESLLSPS